MTRFTHHPRTGAALMVSAGALFALVNTLLQYGTMTLGVGAAPLTFWQYLIALGFGLPFLARFGLGALRTAQMPAHLLRVALATGGVQLWTASLAHVPIWQAIALIMLSPFFVTIGAALALGERTPAPRWIALAVGFTGGLIVLAPWSDRFTVHALLPVGAAALWAMASLMTKRLTASEGPDRLTAWLLILLTPINLALAGGEVTALPASALPVIVGAGLLTAAAQYLLARAYARADAGYLQPFDYLKLPLNIALGIVAFGFVPPGRLWLGAALIVGASVWLVRTEAEGADGAEDAPTAPA